MEQESKAAIEMINHDIKDMHLKISADINTHICIDLFYYIYKIIYSVVPVLVFMVVAPFLVCVYTHYTPPNYYAALKYTIDGTSRIAIIIASIAIFVPVFTVRNMKKSSRYSTIGFFYAFCGRTPNIKIERTNKHNESLIRLEKIRTETAISKTLLLILNSPAIFLSLILTIIITRINGLNFEVIIFLSTQLIIFAIEISSYNAGIELFFELFSFYYASD
jgi:hypothetical protein